ncbi:SDR family NAD(P)-dependent oxidoreductase [Streptomyces sp. HO565]|uniref:SDR family NAD(P)-dependent oxidoreductase n=1 Tax=Streptomyces sp. HO565 TaxID=2857489 RepID=UPI0038B481B1
MVVTNAGVAEGGPFAESGPSVWRRVVEVNPADSAGTARTFLADLFATHGYFLQSMSLASIGAAPMMSAHCASKAGVESFTPALRAEADRGPRPAPPPLRPGPSAAIRAGRPTRRTGVDGAHRHMRVGIAYINWTDTDMVRDADEYAFRLRPEAVHVAPAS